MRGGEVASRQAHNLKTAGSNPVPATIFLTTILPCYINWIDGLSSKQEVMGSNPLQGTKFS